MGRKIACFTAAKWAFLSESFVPRVGPLVFFIGRNWCCFLRWCRLIAQIDFNWGFKDTLRGRRRGKGCCVKMMEPRFEVKEAETLKNSVCENWN